MKKIIFVLMLSCVFLLSGCEKKITNNGKKLTEYNEIDYAKYTEMMENDETFALVIGSSTCSACSLFKGTMEKIITKYQIIVNYIDISKLSEEDYQSLMTEVNFASTPTTIFVENGNHTSVYKRIVGAESYSNVIKTYTKMGYIEE